MSDKELGAGLTCFIVGPIGDRLEPAGTEGKMRYENAIQMWEHVFEPACEVFGLTPVRADKISEAGDINEQIFTYLRDADVVIADVSGGNANVMYELGLRHTRDKVTLQIGEHEHLPFDVSTIRTIKFKRTEAGLIEARNALVELLRSGLEGAGAPVTATRVWNALEGLTQEAVQAASALSFVSDDPADAVDEDGPGNLELMVEGETALNALAGTLQSFTEYMTQMGALAEEHTPAIADSESFAGKLTAMKQFADQLGSPATEMDEVSSTYLTQVQQIDNMLRLVFEELKDDPSELEDENIVGFLDSVLEMAESADEASVSFTDALKVVRDMRKWSTVLKPVSKSMEHSLNSILRGNVIIQAWAHTIKDLREAESE